MIRFLSVSVVWFLMWLAFFKKKQMGFRTVKIQKLLSGFLQFKEHPKFKMGIFFRNMVPGF